MHLNDSFEIGVLRGKLPGFELEEFSEVTAEKTRTLIRLKRGNMPIALLFADDQSTRLNEILILSPLLKNAQGVGINDPLPLSERITCVHDECRAADEPSIIYRIAPKTHTIREIVLQ